MPIIEPKDTSVKNLTGLHLYHAGFSNCSMRVRIALEEKNLAWTSHEMNLMHNETKTPEYFAINPNGVVPTLVDDGVVVIDSADIIDYLDKKYSPDSLRPESEDAQQQMYAWMYLARDNHLSIKTYMYGTLAQKHGRPKRSAAEMAEYRQNQTFDKALLAFHEKFNSDEGITQEDIAQAAQVIDGMFAKMDTRLKDHDWLAGEAFSLADITWIPQLVVLKAAGYPFERHTHFEAWKNAIIKRPSFKTAVMDWLPNTESKKRSNLPHVRVNF